MGHIFVCAECKLILRYYTTHNATTRSRGILALTGITITENGEPDKGVSFENTLPKGKWRVKGAK
jgi:hypothetical protein